MLQCIMQQQVKPGELIGVVGEVGSAKSSLLIAVLGEMVPAEVSTIASTI
jgi:ABC-type phosphonate transport system ATPase subunit